MAELLNLPIESTSILCHAWNKDKSQLALSANSKDVLIFSKSGNKWIQSHVLSEHTSKVLGIDWAPNSNKILTCGADKNAYVWNYDNKSNVWKPDLVVLRINRAATCCKWSPSESKFAVGCGTKCICVCYFQPRQQFWASKHIKKPIKSTITCLEWHPDNSIIACGGTDYKCRVFYAHVEEVDGPAPENNVWLVDIKSECLQEYGSQSSGWVYSVSFSPSGNRLAWVGHDSTIYVIDAKTNVKEVIKHKTPFLPFLSIKFVTESTLIVAGYDCYPIAYSFDGVNVKLIEKLLVGQTSSTTKSTFSALAKFSNLDRLNSEVATSSDQNTIHQNPIKEIYKLDNNKMSTCALDGSVVIWDFKSLESQFKNLKLK